MFYKNMLFVIPLFWYGIVSIYSGTAFYDPYLYQLFNLFFTGMPIMYFAIFDYEQTKEEFMKDSKYYQLGFRSKTLIILCYL